MRAGRPAAGPWSTGTTGSASCARSRSWPSSATAAGFKTAVTRSATAGWTSPSSNPIAVARPGACPAKDRRRCAGRCTRPRTPRAGRVRQTATTTCRRPSGRRQPRLPGARTQAAQALLPHAAGTGRRRARATRGLVAEPRAARQAAAPPEPRVRQTTSVQMLWPLDPGFGSAMQQPLPASRPAHNQTTKLAATQIVRARQALIHTMRRGRLPHRRCRHARVYGLER